MGEMARGFDGNPLGYSEKLKRLIRQDGTETLGISTQTIFEYKVKQGEWEIADELLAYFWDEMHRIGEALFTWMEDILAYQFTRWNMGHAQERASRHLSGLRQFNPSSGDQSRVRACLKRGDRQGALENTELLRVRYASLHDAYVVWIQEILSDLSTEFGEEAVLEVVELTYQHLWKPRYQAWDTMSAIEKLQLSVEGMRGHLSGQRRRGDVAIVEEEDRFVMVLDPCGSCGVLRRGDPESERAPYRPEGNRIPHPWTWGRTDVSWYAVHSPIVMEYLHMKQGRPPMRPHEGCDWDGPCRWYIYKDPQATRPEHYIQMGLPPPDR